MRFWLACLGFRNLTAEPGGLGPKGLELALWPHGLGLTSRLLIQVLDLTSDLWHQDLMLGGAK